MRVKFQVIKILVESETLDYIPDNMFMQKKSGIHMPRKHPKTVNQTKGHKVENIDHILNIFSEHKISNYNPQKITQKYISRIYTKFETPDQGFQIKEFQITHVSV